MKGYGLLERNTCGACKNPSLIWRGRLRWILHPPFFSAAKLCSQRSFGQFVERQIRLACFFVPSAHNQRQSSIIALKAFSERFLGSLSYREKVSHSNQHSEIFDTPNS